jgi:hypothetical protein
MAADLKTAQTTANQHRSLHTQNETARLIKRICKLLVVIVMQVQLQAPHDTGSA